VKLNFSYLILFGLILLVLPLTAATNISRVYGLSFGDQIELGQSSGFSDSQHIEVLDNRIFITYPVITSGITVIVMMASTDGGQSFSGPITISNDGDDSTNPQIVASGSSVYLVWQDNFIGQGDIFFRKGTVSDLGDISFADSVNISNSLDTSANPQLFVSSGHVYVTWDEDTSSGLGYTSIFFGSSLDDGESFSDPENISNSLTTVSQNARISGSEDGDSVYVVWLNIDIDGSGIGDVLFRKATLSNEQINFGETVNLSTNVQSYAQSPKIVASGNNDLYVIWEDAGIAFGNIFFASSPDGGSSFIVPTDTEDSLIGGGTATSPAIVASANSNVNVVWIDSSIGSADILFSKISITGGISTLDNPINLSSSTDSVSLSPRISSSGSSIYVVWQETSPNNILFSASSDNGINFGTPVKLGSEGATLAEPRLSSSGINAYIVWTDQTSSPFDVYFREVADSGPASISIDSVSDFTPIWGIDSVVVSGLANANSTDSVLIDWDDGTSETMATFSGHSWSSTPHTYQSNSVGTHEITARLVDELDIEKVRSTYEVNVLKHTTSLTISPIFSVVSGSDITLNGTLMDTDSITVLQAKSISFSGTGSTGLSSADTTASGDYLVTGSAPDLVAEHLTIQAHFEGDAAYTTSDSDIVSYDTVALGTEEFSVPKGSPTSPIELTNFNTSIQFDDVLSDGSIFVSVCDSPSSSRYEKLINDLCIKISPAVEIAPGSGAHITTSFANRILPAGRTSEDISIFHEGLTEIQDITESRDLLEKTLTGKTFDFSKFIVGAAVHPTAPTGAIRQPVFVGSNDILFNFSQPKEITLNANSYSIGTSAIVTIRDPSANMDSNSEESITANLSSQGDPLGIDITLEETDANSGIFNGTFYLTERSSSESRGRLHVESGDDITASYNEYTRAPFHVLFTAYEAGMAEIVEYSAPTSSNFLPVGDGYELRLIDSSLEPNTDLTISMSYANAALFQDDDPSSIRIMRMEGGTCKEDMTLSGDSAFNSNEKTVTGNTTQLGQYTLAFVGENPPGQCPLPGGGGGGLPRPGTGVVLDAVAVITGNLPSDSQSDTNIGGSHGHRTESIPNPKVQLQPVVPLPPDTYFEEHPLERIEVTDAGFANNEGKKISHSNTGLQLRLTSTISNHQQLQQRYSFIVMILDREGVVADISFREGAVESGKSISVSALWTPIDTGVYNIKIFVWDGMDHPSPLSNPATSTIEIS